ncbi:MAG: DUF2182 domain-containing protein [Mycobacteriales bacterium]
MARSNAVVPGAEPWSALRWLLERGGRRALTRIVLPLLVVAAVAWTLTARAGALGDGSLVGFLAVWALMMTAMMLPAVAPVVAVYAIAARRSVVAPVPFFLGGYLLVWAASGLPAYLVARQVNEPLMAGAPWVARLTGVALLAAAGYQLSPLKSVCLRACRSPMSFFLGRSGGLRRPADAFGAGSQHGVYCLGCCWALMAVLVVLGGMQLGWALALAVVIAAEKLLPWGSVVARSVAALGGSLGLTLLVVPSLLSHLVVMPM